MPPFRAYRVVLAAMADGSSELNEAEMSDLDRLQLRINQKSDETLDSTRRMREMCAEAKVIVGTRIKNSQVHCFPLLPGKVVAQF